uniref:ATP synthase complex subunit 8 n=1 Tax=Petrolisthes haswelli TaxID=1562907 RepID=A0A098GMK6_9EUCA|nr:ATP synthase F0 subunit 8 [Petrolisthes haswelli]CEH11276.1 ATP synthase F0 subunit 8 [Petrolisthes haswelli]
MPQMAPTLWLNLLIMFSIALIFFISVNYFFKSFSKNSKLPQVISTPKKNWKW